MPCLFKLSDVAASASAYQLSINKPGTSLQIRSDVPIYHLSVQIKVGRKQFIPDDISDTPLILSQAHTTFHRETGHPVFPMKSRQSDRGLHGHVRVEEPLDENALHYTCHDVH